MDININVRHGDIPVAVVGCGHLGRIHARILAEHPDCDLVAVVDADPQRAQTVAGALECAALTDVDTLPGAVQAASIVVPTVHHCAVAVPLLERGIACLVEKPLAADLAEADALLEAAARGRALLAAGHVERFQPGVRRVREFDMQPRFIECHRLTPFQFRSLDVGVVHDLMIHDLDLILYFVDSEITHIDCAGGAILTDHEDVASVRLVFANGARANVTASRASMKAMRRFRMFSSHGYVSLDFESNYGLAVTRGPEFESGRMALRDADPQTLALKKDWITTRVLSVSELELGGESRPLQAEIDAFLKSVRHGLPPEVSGEDGRRALELAERICSEIRAQDW